MNPTLKQQIAALVQRAGFQLRAQAYDEAHDISRRVLQLDSNNAEAYNVLGVIALQQNKAAEAEALLRKAAGISRRSPHIATNLARALVVQGNYEAAEAAYRRALNLDPLFSAASLGLGGVLRTLGRPREALVFLERYVHREKNDVDGYIRLGLTYLDLGELALAAEQLRVASRLDGTNKAARRNLAAALLLAENYAEGWPAWMRVFTTVEFPDPASGGAPFRDRRVVVYGTSGVGDEIMYASCLRRLASHAAHITLHCDRRLAPLFRRSFPLVEVIGTDKEGARRIGAVGPQEIHLPAPFLPVYFPPGSEHAAAHFLIPDPAQVTDWKSRFEALGPGLKVGVSWRGGVEQVDRLRRSIPLPEWSSILGIPGVHFINLQHGDVGADMEEARSVAPIHSWSDANPLVDLDFFAAQVAALDLVISVGNTTVHMAGALGTPTWALLPHVPHWWWKMAGARTDWYSCVELFRQQQGGRWANVLFEVETRLRACVASGVIA